MRGFKYAWATTVMAATALAAICTSATARDLTVTAWGGASQAAHKKAYWDAFSQQSGAKLQEDAWNGGIGVLRAKVEAGNANWDVVQVEADEEMLGCEESIFEKLDYSRMGERKAFLDIAAQDCGVGAMVWAVVFGYDADKLKGEPKDWRDFWDVAKFPGKRGMRKTAKYSLEIALLADGVAPADVYKVLRTPAGVDRAFKKLDELRPNIVWWTSMSQVDNLLGSGEVTMSVGSPARMLAFDKENNRNLHAVWKNDLYSVDYWVILKNSPNRAKAMDLIAFMTTAGSQKRFAEAFPSIGISNKQAIAELPPDLSKLTPTAPDHLESGLFIDPYFWVENSDQLNQRFNAWAAK